MKLISIMTLILSLIPFMANAEVTRMSDSFCSKTTGWTKQANEFAAKKYKTSLSNVGLIRAEKSRYGGSGCAVTLDTPKGPKEPILAACVYKVNGSILLHIGMQCLMDKAPS